MEWTFYGFTFEYITLNEKNVRLLTQCGKFVQGKPIGFHVEIIGKINSVGVFELISLKQGDNKREFT